MRLIDADELIEYIQGSDELLDSQKDECIECINACDTAYDVDKVIKEINELSIREFGEIRTEFSSTWLNKDSKRLAERQIKGIEKEIRNKAIEDFANSVKNLIADSCVIRNSDIDDIVEQLKERD